MSNNLSKTQKCILQSISEGKSVIEISEDKKLKLNMTSRQVYEEVNKMKIFLSAKSLAHLIAISLRGNIIK